MAKQSLVPSAPLLSGENPLIDMSAGAGYVKGDMHMTVFVMYTERSKNSRKLAS